MGGGLGGTPLEHGLWSQILRIGEHCSQACPLEPVCVDPLDASLAENPQKTGREVLFARITTAEVLVRPATSPLHCLQGVCVGSVLICVDLCWFVLDLCWFVLDVGWFGLTQHRLVPRGKTPTS